MQGMRRIACCVVAVFCVLCEQAWAADKLPADSPGDHQTDKRILGDRFSFDAGLKFWVAKWQAAGFFNGVNTTRTSDTTALLGPSLNGTVREPDADCVYSS